MGSGGDRDRRQDGMMNFSTRVTQRLGIRYPIIQAGMSWASSNAALALAV
jgi:enoyl-[acyl-carrier protein] reductase II